MTSERQPNKTQRTNIPSIWWFRNRRSAGAGDLRSNVTLAEMAPLQTFTAPSGEKHEQTVKVSSRLSRTWLIQATDCHLSTLYPPSSRSYPSNLEVSTPLKLGIGRQQRNPTVQTEQTNQWIRLILAYARYRRLFTLHVEDAEVKEGGDWSELFWNPRIKRMCCIH